MNNKIIIFSTLTFLLISFVFLSYTETKQADIDTKNLWMVYFENPKDDSLNFTIENHSNTTKFHWTISLDKSEIKNGDVDIANGNSKTIPINAAEMESRKITISITDSENKSKEIYKSF